MGRVRVAVIGVGYYGRNHVRVYRGLPQAELVGVVDTNGDRAAAVAAEFGTRVIGSLDELAGRVDAVSLAIPTVDHARVGVGILERGIDLLVEKPIASSLAEADRLIAAAERNARVLQVGHLERFNPAVLAVRSVLTTPLFFEVHRLGVFTARSLDVDVVYDLMIHDLDIILSLVAAPVKSVHAVGIPILSSKVDIANARVEFGNGCVANVTASRVSTEKVRKLRFFQPHEYVSIDYTRRDAVVCDVADPAEAGSGAAGLPIRFRKLETTSVEPLEAELNAFVRAVETRGQPAVAGADGRRALELAERVMTSIEEHARLVRGTLQGAPRPHKI